MSINQDQFKKLSEMGISLWQSRASHSSSDTEETPTRTYLNIDLKLLKEQQLFNDILLSTGLSIGEIHQQDDHLDLGLFNWFFISDDEQDPTDNNELKMSWSEQQLFTPSIAEISKSPTLKKQLWQLLGSKTQ